MKVLVWFVRVVMVLFVVGWVVRIVVVLCVSVLVLGWVCLVKFSVWCVVCEFIFSMFCRCLCVLVMLLG